MISSSLMKQNAAIKEDFLDLEREIPSQYRKESNNNRVPFGYIYCIENKKNGMKYIGASYSLHQDVVDPGNFAQLKKRATQYIYEYNRGKEMVPSMQETLRPIVRAMVQEGIENFVMYPVSETSYKNQSDLEKFFINKYRTFTHGYNTNRGGKAPVNPFDRRPHSEAAKKARSKEIICINLNEKKIIFSDSMKLFADYMSTTKDMIKNVVRICSQYKGWFIFYTDFDSRNNVIVDLLNNTGVFRTRQTSDKTKAFYKDFHENVTAYLSKENSGMFEDFEMLDPLRYEISGN